MKVGGSITGSINSAMAIINSKEGLTGVLLKMKIFEVMFTSYSKVLQTLQGEFLLWNLLFMVHVHKFILQSSCIVTDSIGTMSAPPSSGDSVAVSTVASGPSTLLSNEIAVTVARTLQQSFASFVTAFHAENLTTWFAAWLLPLFPALFSSVVSSIVVSVVSSSALDAASLLSSSAGTLRLPPFWVYPHRRFY